MGPFSNAFWVFLKTPPADKINTVWFITLGIAPRAGVGFEDYKFSGAQAGGVIVSPNTEIVNGTKRLIQLWSEINPDTGQLRTDLLGAVTGAQTDPSGGPNNSMKKGIRIIGDKALKFY